MQYHCHLVLYLNARIQVYWLAVYSKKLVKFLVIFVPLTFNVQTDLSKKLETYVVTNPQLRYIVYRGYCNLTRHSICKVIV